MMMKTNKINKKCHKKRTNNKFNKMKKMILMN